MKLKFRDIELIVKEYEISKRVQMAYRLGYEEGQAFTTITVVVEATLVNPGREHFMGVLSKIGDSKFQLEDYTFKIVSASMGARDVTIHGTAVRE